VESARHFDLNINQLWWLHHLANQSQWATISQQPITSLSFGQKCVCGTVLEKDTVKLCRMETEWVEDWTERGHFAVLGVSLRFLCVDRGVARRSGHAHCVLIGTNNSKWLAVGAHYKHVTHPWVIFSTGLRRDISRSWVSSAPTAVN